MEQARLAPLVGIICSLGTIVVLIYPYVATGGVGAYYASGTLNPLVGGLLAAVTIIVFAAGREDRTDPGFAAGAALVFGIFATLIVVTWAVSVRVDTVAISQSHRWVAVAVTALVPLSGAWYARTLGLF